MPGPVMNTEEVGLKWEEKKFIIRERKKEMKKIQLKEKRGGERQLWCSADWKNISGLRGGLSGRKEDLSFRTDCEDF